MLNGATVAAFEREFSQYVGARYAIAMSNGTATLEVALRALGVVPGDRVGTTPLTMAATSIAILNAGAVPVYRDVDERTWLASFPPHLSGVAIPVSLYGLHAPCASWVGPSIAWHIDDAAQTLRQHSGAAFTSYSFQASKILSTGEGGMLVTNSEALAVAARELSSLGYRLGASTSRIEPATIKAPTYARHHRYPCNNYRMNDATAALGLQQLANAAALLAARHDAATQYREAVAGCDWLTPHHVPDGVTHNYWCYAVACDTPARALALQAAVVRHGGEMPYGAWRLTYQEPAFRHLAPDGTCPVAESIQPRLLHFQTNDLPSAVTNARALRSALAELAR